MSERFSKRSIIVGVTLLVLVLVAVGVVVASGSSQKSEAPVYWSWDMGGASVGSSQLVRTKNGISAEYSTYGMTPGNAVTLWFIVFNNPELCTPAEDGCSPDDIFGNPAVEADFLLAGGHVIGESGDATFAGHLNVGDTSGSGLAEALCGSQDCTDTSGLLYPDKALVVLGVHDHGPAQTGQVLKEQISSFLGGCDGPFNGNQYGFAEGIFDLPDADGECSTIQFSPHPAE